MCDAIITDLIATNDWHKLRKRSYTNICGKSFGCLVDRESFYPATTTTFMYGGRKYKRCLMYICAACAHQAVIAMRLHYEMSLHGRIYGVRLIDAKKMEDIILPHAGLDLATCVAQYVLLRPTVHHYGGHKDVADIIARLFVTITGAAVDQTIRTYPRLGAIKIYWVEPVLPS